MRYCLTLVVVMLLSSTTAFCQAEKWAKEGAKSLNDQKYQDALSAYKKAAELAPNNNGYAHQIAVCYFTLEKYPEAIEWYSKSIELKPSYVGSYIGRGNSYKHRKKYPLALADFTTAIEKSNNDYTPYYWRARTYIEMDDWEDAIRDLDLSTRLNPKHAYGHFYKGYANYELYLVKSAGEKSSSPGSPPIAKLLDDSYRDYTTSLSLDPKDHIAYCNRGLVSAKMGQYDKAILDYTQSIQLKPTYTSAWYSRGISHERVSKITESYKDYTEAIRLDSCYSSAYINRGIIKADSGNDAGARRDYEKAIACNPRAANAWYNLGILDSKLLKKQDAITKYSTAIEIQPRHESALNNRGLMFLKIAEGNEVKNNFDTTTVATERGIQTEVHRAAKVIDTVNYMLALRDFTSSKNCPVKLKMAYTNRALVLNVFERYAEALADCDEAIARFPTYDVAHFRRAYTLHNMARYTDCLKSYLKSIEIRQDYALAYNNIGVCLENVLSSKKSRSTDLNDIQKLLSPGDKSDPLQCVTNLVEKYYQLAIKHDPKSKSAHQNLGKWLSKNDKHEMAVPILTKAIELDSSVIYLYKYRGRSLAKIGKKEEALADLDYFMEHTPNTDAEAIKVREEYFEIQRQ